MKRISLTLCLAMTFVLFGSLANKASSSKLRRNSLTGVPASVAEEEGIKRAKALVSLINRYRREKGLSTIRYSPNLTYVAMWHVWDLETNNPSDELETDNPACNLHSWSNEANKIQIGEPQNSNVWWSPCCYTDNHAKSKCMWEKPKEITKGAYKGTGYEIAAANGGGITTHGALEQWKGSPGHLSVIINRGKWADNKWKAIGAGISSHYAVVWFGEERDPASSPSLFDFQ